MNVLIEKYDEAYASAKQNIDNTIGLFNTMKTETELSIKDMTGAMTSQMEFLELYSENLRKAAEYGLDDGLIASLSDGSAESAGQINALISEIERLGGSTAGLSGEAAGFVDDFNTQFQGVQEAKEEFASQVADMQTGFSSGMDEIETRMTEAIDNMNMESDAAAAAKETIQAYIDQIKSMTNDAHSAAEGVALAAQSALGGTGVSTVGVPGYATGTTDAPDMFIAGENGPELIVGAGGSTVFPADATNDILSAAGRVPVSAEASPGMERSESESGGVASEKRLTIDLVGSGEFSVKGDYDDETMWSMMSSGLKPLLLGMLRQEIFEEGDEAYAY
jgi:phage-related tail protein